jgi:hypothetical protein
MADYYPLIARAVAGLEKNTGEARRALYERARKALLDQLRNSEPALGESEITRERLALEESIRKVEAEAARQSRLESGSGAAKPPAPSVSDKASGEDAASSAAAAARREKPLRPAPAPERAADSGERPRPEAIRSEFAPKPDRGQIRHLPRNRSDAQRSGKEGGLKGFRDVVAEAETLGGATAQASKSARERFAAVPSPSPEFERIEPHVEPEGLRPASRELIPSHVRETPFPERVGDSPDDDDDRPPIPLRPRALEPEPETAAASGRSFAPYGKIGAIIAVVLALSGTIYWQRTNIASLFGRTGGAAKPPASQTVQESAPSRQKITDRIGPSAQTEAGQAASNAAPGQAPQQVAPVAQRVVLYEEDPQDPAGKRFVGSAIWRTETVSPGTGQPPELAVRADIEIPDRRMTLTWSLRRNNDKTLPASHTVEIMFSVPADFPHGGIANVPGLLMKQAEQTRGVPLAGLAVKVTTGFFLIGLSAVDADMQRNVQLLKDRQWFDIPVVYNDGRRAILAIEKGTPGERAFSDAFAAWGE